MTTEVSSLAFDSRRVRADSIFFAVDGMELDGHEFIPEAILNGAAAVVSERPSPEDFPKVWVSAVSYTHLTLPTILHV